MINVRTLQAITVAAMIAGLAGGPAAPAFGAAVPSPVTAAIALETGIVDLPVVSVQGNNIGSGRPLARPGPGAGRPGPAPVPRVNPGFRGPNVAPRVNPGFRGPPPQVVPRYYGGPRPNFAPAPRPYYGGPRYYGGPVWAYRPWYRRPYYGTIIAGVALGTIIGVTAYGLSPRPPRPDLCWYWADEMQSEGYWDYC